MSLFYLDIDDMKSINDRYGHSVGEVRYDPEEHMDFDDFIQLADGLMYEQKKKKQIAE